MGRTVTYSAPYSDVNASRVEGFSVAALPNPADAPMTPPPTGAAPAMRPAPPRSMDRLCRVATDFWLRALFFASERFPGGLRAMGGPICSIAYALSAKVRKSTQANAARILGPDSSSAERRKLAKGVLRHFYLFCLDVGRSTSMTRDQLLSEISEVTGRRHFETARAAGRGLIVVTAHMGSFEVGLAGLTTQERRLNVIFRRDVQGGFERQRSLLRARLSVRENPIDDGWTMWIRLRDALGDGEAVIFQGDRVMPGQRGTSVPFLHGHLALPTGPVKLARISGSAILPIFSIRDARGKIKLFIEPPITIADDADDGVRDHMLLKLAAVLEKYVRAYPEQWLMLQPAFVEDQTPPATAAAKEVPRG